MAETAVIIHDYKADAVTGRIELHLKCKHTDGASEWHGPVKQYSVDPQTLRDRFNGNIEEFEAWACREHQSIVGVRPGLHEELQSRKGKIIG